MDINTETEKKLAIVIGLRLRSHRQKLGLTLRELAPRLNTTPHELSEYERGIRPLLAPHLCMWLYVLGVDAETFFRPPLTISRKRP